MGPLSSIDPVIVLAFSPVTTIGSIVVRWETLATAAAILVALLLAALLARITPVDLSLPPDAPSPDPDDDGPNHLRADDLLYIAVAALPGAVIGGRIGYGMTHLAYYQANPGALLDTAQGGLQLSLAVVGGLLTASLVAAMLGAPVGRWLHALALPLMFALAGGKAAMILGGSGQGVPSDLSWATSYLGDGPWGSLAPAIPSWPSQAGEALATLAVGGFVWCLMALGVFRARNGAAFFVALGLWAVARALVATTWRDPAVLGPLSADQVVSIAIAGGSAAMIAALGVSAVVRRRRPAPGTRAPAAPA